MNAKNIDDSMKDTSRGKYVVRSSLVCVFTLCVLIGSRVPAATIYFGDTDRAPAQQLQIGDVTISPGWTGFGLPSTVAGLGFGAAGIGSNGIVERTDVITGLGSESLSLSVSGRISSFTILPYWADLANPGVGLRAI